MDKEGFSDCKGQEKQGLAPFAVIKEEVPITPKGKGACPSFGLSVFLRSAATCHRFGFCGQAELRQHEVDSGFY